LHDVTIHRDYNTISVGMIDDHLASLALENAEAILDRNRALVRANLATLAAWVETESRVSWTRPQGGTVTLLRYDADLTSREFCVGLVEGAGSVMFTPGSALGMEGFVRVGFGNNAEVFGAGLPLVTEYLDTLS
jgi:aspartate/methionine/tyrosine aminotransferase